MAMSCASKKLEMATIMMTVAAILSGGDPNRRSRKSVGVMKPCFFARANSPGANSR